MIKVAELAVQIFYSKLLIVYFNIIRNDWALVPLYGALDAPLRDARHPFRSYPGDKSSIKKWKSSIFQKLMTKIRKRTKNRQFKIPARWSRLPYMCALYRTFAVYLYKKERFMSIRLSIYSAKFIFFFLKIL